MVLRRLEASSEVLLLSTGLTPTSHPPMQDPRQDLCLAPYSLLSHLGNHITEAILPRLVLTDPRRPGFRTSLRLPRPLHSCRIDQHIYLPVLLGPYLLELEEVAGRETTVKLLVHPGVVED